MPAARRRFATPALVLLVAAGLVISWGIPGSGWSMRAPSARQTGSLTDARLDESSAVAASRRNPGLAWTANDSGNDPAIFAIDTTGRLVADVRVNGARNRDWEALAVGPCGQRTCVYIGDVGDNLGRRASLTIYRIEEPALEPGDDPITLDVPLRDSLTVRLAGGSRDIEAMVLTPSGDLSLISKGWRERPRVYRVPDSAWSGGTWTAEAIATLPIRTGFLRARLVTDASLTADGSLLAVRTYREVYLFGRSDGSVLPDRPLAACDVAGLEPQGEGLTWWDDGTLLLTSERALGREGPVHLLQCGAD